jgi:hypothetical protein
MSLGTGRSVADVKVAKAAGGTAYTNVFAITANYVTNSTSHVLATELPLIASLPHNQLYTPSKVKIASTSDEDSADGGTGAHLLAITGLGPTGLAQEELMILDGQTPVESDQFFLRVSEMTIFAWGSNLHASGDSASVGDIYCFTGTFVAGVPQYPIIGIAATSNDPNSRVGAYTVPANKIAYIKNIFNTITPDKKDNTSLELMLAMRVPLSNSPTAWFKSTKYQFDRTFNYEPSYVLPLPPLTDVQFRIRVIGTATKIGSKELVLELQDAR